MSGVRTLVLTAAACAAHGYKQSANISAMWETVHHSCENGLCHRHSNSSADVKNTTDCKTRLLMYELGLKLIPQMSPQREVFDALELQSCGVMPPSFERDNDLHVHVSGERMASSSTFYVDYNGGSDTNAGSSTSPFKTVQKGVEATRGGSSATPGTVILLPGVHFLERTIELTAADSGLTITAPPGTGSKGEVWVSGGRPLTPTWSKAPGAGFVYKTPVGDGFNVSGLNTLNSTSPGQMRRATQARYPNADPELCRSCWEPAGAVVDWPADVSCIGKARVVYKDLRACGPDGKHLPDGGPCKADSAMWDSYNTYTNGHGGCCAVWEGDGSPYGPMGDYYCGNSSAGGWVGNNDPRGANHTLGQSPILPSAMVYNLSKTPGMANLTSAKGGRLTVWRHQGWYLNMFEIESHTPPAGTGAEAIGTVKLAYERGHVKGGWQGGRGWDKQSPHLADAVKPGYILAGG